MACKFVAVPAFVLTSVCGSVFGQLTYSESSGPLAASVEFSIDGSGALIARLTNTSQTDVLVPADVLSAVFFNISGNPSLTATQAVLTPGSLVYYDLDGQPAGGIVGGEWGYKSGLSGAPGNRAYGISSAGLNLFGPADLFPGPDLAPPPSPDGVNYGILSAGDDTGTGNSGILGSGGLIKNSVIFTLSGAGQNFDLNRIGSVFFQYGTAFDEPGYQGGVPAPSSALALLFGGVLTTRRRRTT